MSELGIDDGGSPKIVPPHKVRYPDGLMAWAGHRAGGVRKPFRADSGRPAGGMRIETPLITRLESWIKSLVADEPNTPTSIILVGGPGNGKTDSVETCIEFLDCALGADGKLFSAFRNEFEVPLDSLPPRKAVVDLATLPLVLPPSMNRKIYLVQDATEDAPDQDRSKELLLLDDLRAILQPENRDIYLCCVNRGVLAQTSTLAHDTGENDQVALLVDRMTEAATCFPGAPICWPLEGFAHIAIWPMDVESIVDASHSAESPTVAHQVFEVALDELHWTNECAAGARCPFCRNRKLLSNKKALDGLVQILRYYEIASGKRWTFRDLFSLISYILVGDYSEFIVNGKQISPCEWAAYQIGLTRSKNLEDINVARAPYLLVSKLYYHRLFPTWPTFTSGTHGAARRAIFLKHSLSSGLQYANNFYRHLSSAVRLRESLSGDVPKRITSSLSPMLDPALMHGGQHFGDGKVTAAAIEDAFSLSVAEGLTLTKSSLEPLERDVLNLLVLADEELADEKFPSNRCHHATLLQSTIRQFSGRLVKRSLGVRTGTCHDCDLFERYEAALRDTKLFRGIAKQLKHLLHDEKNQFAASVVTTFGQPVAQRSREVILLTENIAVKELPREDIDGRPANPISYLQVEGNSVAITFPLFKALEGVSDGLHSASLPEEIFALLNGTRSIVSGKVVRSASKLSDDAVIRLGSSGREIEIVNNAFVFGGGN